jgi:hypothetical protein
MWKKAHAKRRARKASARRPSRSSVSRMSALPLLRQVWDTISRSPEIQESHPEAFVPVKRGRTVVKKPRTPPTSFIKQVGASPKCMRKPPCENKERANMICLIARGRYFLANTGGKDRLPPVVSYYGVPAKNLWRGHSNKIAAHARSLVRSIMIHLGLLTTSLWSSADTSLKCSTPRRRGEPSLRFRKTETLKWESFNFELDEQEATSTVMVPQ